MAEDCKECFRYGRIGDLEIKFFKEHAEELTGRLTEQDRRRFLKLLQNMKEGGHYCEIYLEGIDKQILAGKKKCEHFKRIIQRVPIPKYLDLELSEDDDIKTR